MEVAISEDDLNCQKGKITHTLVGNRESLKALKQGKKAAYHLCTCPVSVCSFEFLWRQRLRQVLGTGSLLERRSQGNKAWEREMESGKGKKPKIEWCIIQLAILCSGTIVWWHELTHTSP